jgi:hypothetical protein
MQQLRAGGLHFTLHSQHVKARFRKPLSRPSVSFELKHPAPTSTGGQRSRSSPGTTRLLFPIGQRRRSSYRHTRKPLIRSGFDGTTIPFLLFLRRVFQFRQPRKSIPHPIRSANNHLLWPRSCFDSFCLQSSSTLYVFSTFCIAYSDDDRLFQSSTKKVGGSCS